MPYETTSENVTLCEGCYNFANHFVCILRPYSQMKVMLNDGRGNNKVAQMTLNQGFYKLCTCASDKKGFTTMYWSDNPDYHFRQFNFCCGRTGLIEVLRYLPKQQMKIIMRQVTEMPNFNCTKYNTLKAQVRYNPDQTGPLCECSDQQTFL
jgi:hypothetical protein